MALVWSLHVPPKSFTTIINPNNTISPNFSIDQEARRSVPKFSVHFRSRSRRRFVQCSIVNESGKESDPSSSQDEISPLLPKSCQYVPTCSEYSMIAYKKYGSVKGSILTVWLICCCNPFGGSGFDPPRWFDEPSPPEQ